MSKELGLPTFFITLTQNDNWEEFQSNNSKGPGTYGSSFSINETDFLNKQTSHCFDFSVETYIALNQRFELFKEKFLTKSKIP